MSDISPIDPARPNANSQPASRLNLDQAVDDFLILTTLGGAEDYLQGDLSQIPDVASRGRQPAAITVQLSGSLRSLLGSRLFSAAAIPLSGAPHREPDLSGLSVSLAHGVLSALTGDGPLRFRVGVPDSGLRKQVIGRVVATLGWINDPTDWDVNLTVTLARWTAQIGALHYSRRFPAYDRTPWSTNPLVAETLIRLAKPTPGAWVHDPCCGTGTVLVAAHYNGAGEHLTGTDHDRAMIEMAARNLERHSARGKLEVVNATPISAPHRSVDRVVSNLPFGKQVGSHEDNVLLYPAIAHEIARVLTGAGRAVLLTEDKTLLRASIQLTKGLKLVSERLLRYGGATPTALVLARTRH